MVPPALMLSLLSMVELLLHFTSAQLVPAVMIFGDSTVDAGNNNVITTFIRANFPPYGRDFDHQRATGRFCNGKLATDFTVDFLGFTSYPPPYQADNAAARRSLIGANFGSAASGYLDTTSLLYHSMPLKRQLDNYREYQKQLMMMIGQDKVRAIVNSSLHVISTGTSDWLHNYYINPLDITISTDSFMNDDILPEFNSFLERLYGLGARKIGVTGLPPIGCLPAAITMFGSAGSNQCVDRLNRVAVEMNNKLAEAGDNFVGDHPDMKLVVFNIYDALLNVTLRPTDYGFFESRRGCCGTGTFETSLMCNKYSPGTCSNASGYVYWDAFHPSQAANQLLSQELISQGLPLIG